MEDVIILHWPQPSGTRFTYAKEPKGIRMIHVPTATVVTCTEHNSMFKNREEAELKLFKLIEGKPTYEQLKAQVEDMRELCLTTAEVQELQAKAGYEGFQTGWHTCQEYEGDMLCSELAQQHANNIRNE